MSTDMRTRCTCSEPHSTPEPTCPEHGIQHEPDDIDPSDLPKRMAEAIAEKFTSPKLGKATEETDWEEPVLDTLAERVDKGMAVFFTAGDGQLSFRSPTPREVAEVALSVRDELVAHLAARAAKAEARVEHAEAGAQLSSERLAKVRTELDRLWSPAPDSAGRHAAHCEWGPTSGAYCSCVGLAEIARLRAERNALKIAVEALAERWENALAPDRPYARDLRAALNTETTTTPARETV